MLCIMAKSNYSMLVDSWMTQANDPYATFYAYEKGTVPPREMNQAQAFMIWNGIEVEVNGFLVKKGTVVGGSRKEPIFFKPKDFAQKYDFLEVSPVSFRPVRDGSIYRQRLDAMKKEIYSAE